MIIRKTFLVAVSATIATGSLVGCVATKCGLGCPGDAQITSQIQDKMSQHAELGTRVHVQTIDRVVYLSGYVSAGEFRNVAEQLAKSTPGVKRVEDTIAATK
jgi:osmotically-inducible protein OsmY